MNRKIVAIGGGENGRMRPNGEKYPYETAPMDKEIIRLTEKEHPNFLFIGHSQPLEIQKGYFNTMVNIYNKIYGCECKMLRSDELYDNKKIKELIDWADIIYEGGGDTKNMIELWKNTGFDKVLESAYENGKVMCGVSAGANCWFKICNSDSLRIQLKDDTAPLIKVDCLGLINASFTPHCDEGDRLESTKNFLEDEDIIGISLSNCCAIEIVDDKYRLITSDASYHNIKPFGIKSYWENGIYYQEYIKETNEFLDLDKLLQKNKNEKIR